MRSSLPLSWPAFLISPSRRLNRHSAEHRNPFAEHLERHPVALQLAPDPGIAFGLELGDGSGVCHPRIKARTVRERTSFRPRSIPEGPYVWVHPDEERYAAIGSTMGAVERRCSSTAMVSLRLSRRAANVPASKGYVTFERSNTPTCSSSVAMSQLRHWTTRSRSEISVLICAASRSALSFANPIVFHFRAP